MTAVAESAKTASDEGETDMGIRDRDQNVLGLLKENSPETPNRLQSTCCNSWIELVPEADIVTRSSRKGIPIAADPITSELERQMDSDLVVDVGRIASMARRYQLGSDRLLGLVLKLDFAESIFVTCDPWKRKCSGVPRGSFVLFRMDPRALDEDDRAASGRIVLARVTNSAPTPVESNVQQTLFQVHKLQAQLDPLTHKDLQWSALKASIVGTFFDEQPPDGGLLQIGFGNDVDTFFSPFAYVAYMPTDDDLATLINSFVRCERPVEIGRLRYTETPSPGTSVNVSIYIDPRDIVGEPTAAQRLANFGKTRFGKSNSNKIIARAVFESGMKVSQVFFDPSGEYTYINDQDGTSIFSLYPDRSVRYSIAPKPLRDDERRLRLQPAHLLAIDFYRFASVGHSLIQALWSTENSTMPGYWRPVVDWSPVDVASAPDRRTDRRGFNHYWRTMGMWFALLHRAGFVPPPDLTASIDFRREVKAELASIEGIQVTGRGQDRIMSDQGQPIVVLPAIYRRIATLRKQHTDWFPNSADGSAYFSDTEEKLLQMLSDDGGIIAHNYIRPFNKYHSPRGGSIFDDIARHVGDGKSIFIDMSQSNEAVRNNLVDRVCRAIFHEQNRRFNSQDGVGDRFVMFYFEEAHRLFNKDDTDLNSIYNLLAKEGAKLNIAMVYATQSMTTISPDLIKNTDNFLIAHLDDDREAKEVARKFAFRDLADDVQRIQSKGFVRMITRSHRFALPVQIHRFRSEQ
jgi:Helicase HerA, central domain